MRWSVLLVVLPLLPTPAGAQQGVAACGPPRAGQVACVANRLCVCRFERGGSLAARPDRWAWDCGILRPDCSAAPAEQAPLPQPDILLVPPLAPLSRPQR